MATLLKMCKLHVFKVTSHRKYVFATTELAPAYTKYKVAPKKYHKCSL